MDQYKTSRQIPAGWLDKTKVTTSACAIGSAVANGVALPAEEWKKHVPGYIPYFPKMNLTEKLAFIAKAVALTPIALATLAGVVGIEAGETVWKRFARFWRKSHKGKQSKSLLQKSIEPCSGASVYSGGNDWRGHWPIAFQRFGLQRVIAIKKNTSAEACNKAARGQKGGERIGQSRKGSHPVLPSSEPGTSQYAERRERIWQDGAICRERFQNHPRRALGASRIGKVGI